ncbi:hypothetical protein [Actinobacillus equuli]|uniref:hypothetical protein n=1 Tax=Actinobacillus equuli TaxID=718 RepID=UPI0024418C39|nr:hypothetical protein [Actinobacillus equuli]WGE57306.1 hypothetical protein NYR71_00700 [Actinobacillus equuli subsp. equuli]
MAIPQHLTPFIRIVMNLTQEDIALADKSTLSFLADGMVQLQQAGLDTLDKGLVDKLSQVRQFTEQTQIQVAQRELQQAQDEILAERQERQRMLQQIRYIEESYRQKENVEDVRRVQSERERRQLDAQQQFAAQVARYMAMTDAEFNRLSDIQKAEVIQTLQKSITEQAKKLDKTNPASQQVLEAVNHNPPLDNPPSVNDKKYYQDKNGLVTKQVELQEKLNNGKLTQDQYQNLSDLNYITFSLNNFLNPKAEYHKLSEEYVKSLAKIYGVDYDELKVDPEFRDQFIDKVYQDANNGQLSAKLAPLKQSAMYSSMQDIGNIDQLKADRKRQGQLLGDYIIKHTETGKWLGESPENALQYYQLRFDYAKATFREMSAKLSDLSLSRTASLPADQVKTITLTMHFGQGQFKGEQAFVVRQPKDEKNMLMSIYQDILSTGFQDIANLPTNSKNEKRVKYNAVSKLLEDFVDQNTHFTFQSEGKGEVKVAELNEVHGKLLALIELKGKYKDDQIVFEHSTLAMQSLEGRYADLLKRFVEDQIKNIENRQDVSDVEIQQIANQLAKQVISTGKFPDANLDPFKNAELLAAQYATLTNLSLKENKEDKENNKEKSFNKEDLLAEQVKEHNGLIGMVDIETVTLERVHQQEVAKRQLPTIQEPQLERMITL